jgi:hypothetical protein
MILQSLEFFLCVFEFCEFDECDSESWNYQDTAQPERVVRKCCE